MFPHSWETFILVSRKGKMESTERLSKEQVISNGDMYLKLTKQSPISSVQFSRSVVSYSLWPHGLQHARPPCPSPTPRVYSNSCPLSQWCHPTISSFVVPFSSRLRSFPASRSFPMSQLFAWGVQSTGASALASFLPKKSQGWSPSEWTGWISLQSKGLSRVFSNTTVNAKNCINFFKKCEASKNFWAWDGQLQS